MANIILPGGTGQAQVIGSPNLAFEIAPISQAVGATLATMTIPASSAAGGTTADFVNVSPRAVADNGNPGDVDAKLRLPTKPAPQESGLAFVATRDGTDYCLFLPWGEDTGTAGVAMPVASGESITVIVRYPLDGTRPNVVLRVGAGPLGEAVVVKVAMAPDVSLTRAALNSIRADINTLRTEFAQLAAQEGIGAPPVTTQINSLTRSGNRLTLTWTRNGVQQSDDVNLPSYHDFELVASAAELATKSVDETLLVRTAFGTYTVGDVLSNDGTNWVVVLNLATASVLTPNSVSKDMLTQALRDDLDSKLDAAGVDTRIGDSIEGKIAQSIRNQTQIGTGTITQGLSNSLTRVGTLTFPAFLPADQIMVDVEYGPNDDSIAHTFNASDIPEASQSAQADASNSARFLNATSGETYSIAVETGTRRVLFASSDIGDYTPTFTLVRTFVRREFLPSSLGGGGGGGGLSQSEVDARITALRPNAFTDADETKLDGIEDNATADQTATEIRDKLAGLAGTNRLAATAIKDLPAGGGLDTAAVDARIKPPARTGNTTRWGENNLPQKLDDILDAFHGDSGWKDAGTGGSTNIYVSSVFSQSSNVVNPNQAPYTYANQDEVSPRQTNVYAVIRKPDNLALADHRYVITNAEGGVLTEFGGREWIELVTVDNFTYYVTPVIADIPVGATQRVQEYTNFTVDRERLGLGPRIPKPDDPADDGKALIASGGRASWTRISRASAELLQDGVGVGHAVTLNGTSVRGNFTPFSPQFNLNDLDNMHGEVEFEILLTIPTRSSDSIGFDETTNPATTARISGFTFASRIRELDAYANNANNGVKIGQQDIFMGSGTTLGRIEAYVARRLSSGVNELGYYLYYAGGAVPPAGSQSFNFSSYVGALFNHTDHSGAFSSLRRTLVGTAVLTANRNLWYNFTKPGGGRLATAELGTGWYEFEVENSTWGYSLVFYRSGPVTLIPLGVLSGFSSTIPSNYHPAYVQQSGGYIGFACVNPANYFPAATYRFYKLS